MVRHDSRRRGRVIALLVTGMLVVLAIGTVPRALADDVGITVNVEVLGTSASATPVETVTAGPTGGTGGGGASATASSGQSTSAPTPTVGPGGETSIGGVLYVSGLTMTYTPSINPLDGHVTMRFTVRNAYTKPVDGKATFWVTTWLGNRVGHQVDVVVPAIAPGEVREITVTVRGVGQWGILTGHATFVPPPWLDDIPLTAVTRTGTLVYIPWFVVVILTGGWAWFATRRRHAKWWSLFTGAGGRP